MMELVEREIKLPSVHLQEDLGEIKIPLIIYVFQCCIVFWRSHLPSTHLWSSGAFSSCIFIYSFNWHGQRNTCAGRDEIKAMAQILIHSIIDQWLTTWYVYIFRHFSGMQITTGSSTDEMVIDIIESAFKNSTFESSSHLQYYTVMSSLPSFSTSNYYKLFDSDGKEMLTQYLTAEYGSLPPYVAYSFPGTAKVSICTCILPEDWHFSSWQQSCRG